MNHMRDKRAIVIKDPQLQKVRNDLRIVLMKAVNKRLIELLHARERLRVSTNGVYRTIDDLSPDELKQFRQLQDQESKLRDLADRSICYCVECKKPDRDMVYNKAYDAWYCTECYGMERAYAKELQQKRAKTGGKPKGHEEKAIENHSKTFL